MRYLLDTNICIYIIKRRPVSVLKRFEALQPGAVGMSMVTFGELKYGALKSQQAAKALDVLEALAAYIPVIACDAEVADHYAEIRAHLSHRGQMIGNNDLWIAAHARALQCTLVTNNMREFQRVPALTLENWVE